MSGALGVSLTVQGEVILRITSDNDEGETTTAAYLEPEAARRLATRLTEAAEHGESVRLLIAEVDEIESDLRYGGN